MLGWIKQLFAGPSTTPKPQTGGRLEPESRFVVSFGDQRIVCRRPNDTEESVTWDDLNAVIIETNDTGPLDTDVWWILVGQGAKSGCLIPGGATGEKELLERLQKLPGFDNAKLIDAMGCTDNKRFVCWQRAANDLHP
jgi:hypothetical protein